MATQPNTLQPQHEAFEGFIAMVLFLARVQISGKNMHEMSDREFDFERVLLAPLAKHLAETFENFSKAFSVNEGTKIGDYVENFWGWFMSYPENYGPFASFTKEQFAISEVYWKKTVMGLLKNDEESRTAFASIVAPAPSALRINWDKMQVELPR